VNKKIFFIFFIFTVLSISGFYVFVAIKDNTIQAKAAFGISPPYVDELKLHPGDSVVDYITIMRSNSEKEIPINMNLKALNIDSWLELIPKNLVFKKGDTQAILGIKINVPKDAKAGIYSGKLFTTLGPDKKNGVAVALGGLINISLRVIK
jgi:hypothetical protein